MALPLEELKQVGVLWAQNLLLKSSLNVRQT